MGDELTGDGADTETGDPSVGDADAEDVFHHPDGTPVLGDASAFEVGLYAHHCWVLGLDPEATAALLQESS